MTAADHVWSSQNRIKALRIGLITRKTEQEVATLPNTPLGKFANGSLEDSPADAVRHATWSCRIAKTFDEATATTVGNNHEQPQSTDGDHERRAHEMDQRNNAAGRRLAQSVNNPEECFNAALQADLHGELQDAP